ncbi:hypothetical protein Pcinc_002443 [Petrolisthes cinctipes]|uniref:F5/8 type C domain-containing protein n=1 Tax=Petrolisthes cinctipes TaxID=88211 RepID=A0AAE1L284_PETCI|nr:hypothetical protein Pcinc_002443 [Petrolisthes cinctipes]
MMRVWKRVISMFLLLLFLLRYTTTTTIIPTYKFQKIQMATEVTKCLQERVYVPQSLALISPKVFCTSQCAASDSCTAVCLIDNTCQLLNVKGTSSEYMSSPVGVVGDNGCMVRFDPSSKPPWSDLAWNKTVIDSGTWDGVYAPGYTTVKGWSCELTQYDCFCSKFELYAAITIDLGSTQPVSTVVVTVSSFFPNYFKEVDIRVGESGTKEDGLLVQYDGPPSSGATLSFTGTSTLMGRYVRIYRRSFFSNSLCLCLVHVFAELEGDDTTGGIISTSVYKLK